MDKAVNIKREPIGNGRYIYVSDRHTFGTDAVLLAHFAKPKRNDTVADLGTGCGIIPFLMLRDQSTVTVTGVDIEKEAIDLCNMTASKENFSGFSAVLSDICDLKGKISFGDKTLVTCNPPYKAADAGIRAKDRARDTARFESSGTLRDIVSVAASLLTFGGRLCMCQRPERLSELINLMSEYKVEPKRLRLVSKKVGSAPWLFLLEGRRGGKPGTVIEPTLYIYEGDELSREMKEIYGPYKEAYL